MQLDGARVDRFRSGQALGETKGIPWMTYAHRKPLIQSYENAKLRVAELTERLDEMYKKARVTKAELVRRRSNAVATMVRVEHDLTKAEDRVLRIQDDMMAKPYPQCVPKYTLEQNRHRMKRAQHAIRLRALALDSAEKHVAVLSVSLEQCKSR